MLLGLLNSLVVFVLVLPYFSDATSKQNEALPEATSCTGLSILAWNIQILGQKKMDNVTIINIVTKVMVEHDIILVQEIRDAEETVPGRLLDALNTASGSAAYNYVVSTRLGSTSSKEQYAIYYRTDKGRFSDHHVYDDTANKFERPPIVARFEANVGASDILRDFFFAGIHTKPDDAKEEIDALVDVYDTESNQYSQPNAILMGDFNADCTYVCKSCWDDIRLRTEERFHWPIGDNVDTTTTNTDCAYDRFVYIGNEVINTFAGAEIIDFQKIYGLTTELTQDVSDHYPIRMVIRCQDDNLQRAGNSAPKHFTFFTLVIFIAVAWLLETC